MSFLKDALAYASMGLAVFPLTPGSKRPIAGSNGLKDATTDPARIGLWWGTQHPDANIGIVTGAISGITVLDVDSKKDVHGDMTLAALVAEHGSLPLTPKQATPSGGTHYVFAYAPGVRNSAGKLGKGLDIRGDGGYIAVAPSVVSEDRRTGTYTWERAPFDQALAPMPAWLLERVESAGATKPKSIRDMADAGRNVALTSLAGTMRRRDASEEAVRQALLAENAGFPTPLPVDEVERIVASAMRNFAPAEDGPGRGHTDEKDLVLTRFADIPMKPVPWLWPSYITSGAPTLLVGDPDLGKTLVACDLAARVSTGRPWPDGISGPGRSRDVIFLSAEDSAQHTLRPRLEAAGADTSRVHRLTSRNPNAGLLSLKTDVARVEAMLHTVDAALLIVDPLSAYLPGVDTFKDNEVRSTLAPFVAMAERTGITVLAIVHLSKNVERNALQRVLGSVAFTALSRATYVVARDPEDPNCRLFLSAKMNLGPRPAGLAYTVVGTRLDAGISTAKVKWSPVRITMTPDEALRRAANPRPSDDAAGIFREALANGPVLANTMEALCAEKAIAPRTADRTKERLGIRSVQTSAGWYWTPPGWSDEQRKAWRTAQSANGAVAS